MMKGIFSLARIFLAWTLVGVLSKVAFILMYADLMVEPSWHTWAQIIGHGLRLDLAVAGYLSLLPGVMLAVEAVCSEDCKFWQTGAYKHVWRTYFALTAGAVALALVSNLGLYAYWGFPLDDTPLLYLRTSPADAMASLTGLQFIVALVALAAAALAIYWLIGAARFMPAALRGAKPAANGGNGGRWRKACEALALLLLTALLILPIRGGVSTGTNHTGSVYFSQDIRVNHAAVNPVFSFIEAVTHHQDIGSLYRFMTDEEAARLLPHLLQSTARADDGLNTGRPNVILICMEGFSRYVMAEGGHVMGVTPCLDSLTREGLYFDRIMANSFRTDRGLVSVLSGLPAQPTMSVMDMPRLSTSLPSLASSLASEGYRTTFYYGGDINYSNMRSYLVGTGFETIVCDRDFPSRLHTGKWGVADGPLMERLLHDITVDAGGSEPWLRVMLTGSSHEPFDVPEQRLSQNAHRTDGALNEDERKVLNAFAYTDYHLGRLVRQLQQMPEWQNTLLILVPDHLGAYPLNIDNYALWRYEIPLLMLGGPAGMPRRISTLGGQIDIAATLLAMMGMDHSAFTWSKDLLDEKAPHFAFFTFPDAMGLVTDSSQVIFDNTAHRSVLTEGSTSAERYAKAYLQALYDQLSKP